MAAILQPGRVLAQERMKVSANRTACGCERGCAAGTEGLLDHYRGRARRQGYLPNLAAEY